MKAYKGFKVDKDGKIYCQPTLNNKFYYEEGKTYECKVAVLCACGFHACTLPIDVFKYYNSNCDMVEYHEVELEGVSDERRNDSKIVGTKITIGRKVTIDEILDISIKMILDDKEKYFYNNKLYKIRKDNKCNFIKPDGTLLSSQWFDDVCKFENGLAQVELNSKYNIIKPDGTYLTEQWFDYADDFINGIAIVCIGKYPNDKLNFIRKDGTLVSEKWYDDVWDFENGFARVKLKDKYNFIKPDGTYLSNQWFEYAGYFSNGFARVQLNEKWYKLNEKGELI